MAAMVVSALLAASRGRRVAISMRAAEAGAASTTCAPAMARRVRAWAAPASVEAAAAEHAVARANPAASTSAPRARSLVRMEAAPAAVGPASHAATTATGQRCVDPIWSATTTRAGSVVVRVSPVALAAPVTTAVAIKEPTCASTTAPRVSRADSAPVMRVCAGRTSSTAVTVARTRAQTSINVARAMFSAATTSSASRRGVRADRGWCGAVQIASTRIPIPPRAVRRRRSAPAARRAARTARASRNAPETSTPAGTRASTRIPTLITAGGATARAGMTRSASKATARNSTPPSAATRARARRAAVAMRAVTTPDRRRYVCVSTAEPARFRSDFPGDALLLAHQTSQREAPELPAGHRPAPHLLLAHQTSQREAPSYPLHAGTPFASTEVGDEIAIPRGSVVDSDRPPVA